MNIIMYEWARLTTESQRFAVAYPREFLRGWEEAQGDRFHTVYAGMEHHGLVSEAAEAYQAGWAEFTLRRPILNDRESGIFSSAAEACA